MTMKREKIWNLINNPAFVTVMQAMRDTKTTRAALIAALNTLKNNHISADAINEVQSKIDEYNKIESSYSNMLEDIYGVTWHWWALLEKYINDGVSSEDDLPEYAKPA